MNQVYTWKSYRFHACNTGVPASGAVLCIYKVSPGERLEKWLHTEPGVADLWISEKHTHKKTIYSNEYMHY